MRKIPKYYENPIDSIILDFADKLLPFFKKTGHTPNMITTYSFISGIMSLYFLWNKQLGYFIVFYIIGYIFDCIDGHMARTYNMVTKTGDLYDHFTDYAIGVGISYIILTKYSNKLTIVHFIIAMSFFILTNLHIGCQQKYYNENKMKKEDDIIESINGLSKFCKSTEKMKWTRFFGTATLSIVMLILIYNITY